MKLIALMATWDNLEFFKLAYGQAKKHCDKVYVMVGPHSYRDRFVKSDETKKWLDGQNQDYLETNPLKTVRYDEYQCFLWSKLLGLGKTGWSEDDNDWWFRFWDDDMIFFDDQITFLKGEMERTKADCFQFAERRFLLNFTHCTTSITGFFHRMTKGMHLTPISRLWKADGTMYREHAVIYDNVICHHYCGVKTKARQMARFEMSREKGTPGIDEIIKHYNDFNISCPSEPEHLIGGEDYRLYLGKHPDCVYQHPWFNVEDTRKL